MAITLCALGAAWVFFPSWTNVTPVLACFFLLALLLRKISVPVAATSNSQVAATASGSSLGGVTLIRIGAFLLLQSAVFALIALLRSRASGYLAGELLAAVRYAVLLPPLVLMPWKQWRSFTLTHGAELIAATIFMLTWFPHRLFMTAWPYYSQLLGHTVYFLAHPFVSTLHFVPDATPTLLGPSLDITILFGCSGLQATKLFQLLFAFVLIVDWPVLNHRRVLRAYFAGMSVALLANVLRIVLLVVLGNLLSADMVVRLHVGAGWVFFAAVFSAFFWFTYDWLRRSGQANSSAHQVSALPAISAR